MNALKIPHMSFVDMEVETPISKRELLANRAYTLLGYSTLQALLSVSGSLRKALKELDISPLVSSEVKKYQRSKAKNGMWSGHKEGIVWLFITFLTATLTYHLASIGNWRDGDIHVAFAISLSVASAIFLWRGLYLLFNTDARGHRTTRSWKSFPIASYPHEIPDFVLNKAVQIKEIMPQVSFTIEQLIIEMEKHQIPDPDPFLVAHSVINKTKKDKWGNDTVTSDVVESFYIDVWDEKDFERKLYA